MIDKELLEQFQMMMAAIEKVDMRMEKVDMRMDKVEESIRHTNVLIENEVAKRIETLFDGYKLNHEKQWELERKFDKLEARIERLETKTA